MKVGIAFYLPTIMLQLLSYIKPKNDHNHLLPFHSYCLPFATIAFNMFIVLQQLSFSIGLNRPTSTYRPLVIATNPLQPRKKIITL
jgi:hypothetical protein